MCRLGLLCCLRGVLGFLAPIHRCARSVCCAACCVCGGLGTLAPVHRSARWVCCAACVGRRCGARTRPSGRRPYVAGRGCVPSGSAHVHPDSSCFVAGRGWVRYRERTRPSGRQLFRSRQRLGSLPGAHTSLRTVAGVAWHLFACRGSLRVVRSVRFFGTRWPLLLGTCPCALALASGEPLWRASWPHVVRRACSGPVVLGAPVGFPDAVVPFPSPPACAPGFTGGLRGARGGRPRTGVIVPLPLAPAAARALGSLLVVPARAAQWGCPWRVPTASVVGLGCCVGLPVWTRSLTRPVSRTVRPWTGDSAGAPGLIPPDAGTSLFGLEDATPGSRTCVRSSWPRRAGGRPTSRARFGAPHLSCGRPVFLLCLAPSGLGSPLSCPFVCVSPPPFFLALFFVFRFFFSFAPPLSPAFSGFRPWVSWALALSAHPPRPPPPLCFFFFLVVFLPLCWVWCLFPSSLLDSVFLSFVFVSFRPAFPLSPPLPLSFFPLFFFLFGFPPPFCLLCGSPAAWLPVCSSVFSFFSVVLCCWGAACCCVSLAVLSCCNVRVAVCCRVLVCVAVCCAVLCPWMWCCAALLRVALPGVVLFCAVLRCVACLVPLLAV